MTSILKNQILKHLTKFTKNLSPEKIKINAFKGEGDVSNLELDEVKLTELLELPNWLKIKHAACNKVMIKVQWTMIKKVPIILVLDEIICVVEALQTPRQPKISTDAPSYRGNTGSYGFTDRVIDGIKVKINMVRIIFTSATFKANIELMRVVVTSKMPNWGEADHLKKSRVKSPGHGAVLLFKEIEWDTTRIEANALKQNVQATPLKLITNTTKIRLIIKKNLADCAILESKVEFILNDLFWVLTISQIKAAIMFTESLMGLIQKSNELNKEAARVRMQNVVHRVPYQTPIPVANPTNSSVVSQPNTNPAPVLNQTGGNNRLKLFLKHDLKETSYHILIARVEFHFCEEGEQGTSMTKNSVVNGSLKLLISNTEIDLYPCHISSMTRCHFPNYKDLNRAREKWLLDMASQPHQAAEDQQKQQQLRIMESVTLVRFNDITVNCVCSTRQSRCSVFVSSDIGRHRLPPRTSTFSLDYTEHYAASDSLAQTSAAAGQYEDTLFVQANPLSMRLDWPTVLWLNAFYIHLSRDLDNVRKKAQKMISEVGSELFSSNGSSGANNMSSTSSSGTEKKSTTKINKRPIIHIEAIMPRIVLGSEKQPTPGQPDRPSSLQALVGTLSVDNMLRPPAATEMVQHFQDRERGGFMEDHLGMEMDCGRVDLAPFLQALSSESTSTSSSMWQVRLEPVWLEFEGATNYSGRSRPFVEPANISLLVNGPSRQRSLARTSSVQPALGVLCWVEPSTKLDVRLDHYQVLLLYRLLEEVAGGSERLKEDVRCFFGDEEVTKRQEKTVNVMLQVDDLSATFLWQPLPPPSYQLSTELPVLPGNGGLQNGDLLDAVDMEITTNSASEPVTRSSDDEDPVAHDNQAPSFLLMRAPSNHHHHPLVGSRTGSPELPNNNLATVGPGGGGSSNVDSCLQSNRRSYTSLSTILTEPQRPCLSSSNLLNYKSVKNLIGSAGGGRLSRKGSHTSIASSSGGLDIGSSRTSIVDSDNSDWISEGLLGPDELGDVEMAGDLLLDLDSVDHERGGSVNSGGGGEAAGDADASANSTSSSSLCCLQFRATDARLQIGSCQKTSIAIGIYGDLFVDESQNVTRNVCVNRLEDGSSTISPGSPLVLCRIEVPTENHSLTETEVVVCGRVCVPLLMSSVSGLAEMLEDERAPDENGAVLSPVQLRLASAVRLCLREDRRCSLPTCPGRHADTEVEIPAGVCCVLGGTASALRVSLGLMAAPVVSGSTKATQTHQGTPIRPRTASPHGHDVTPPAYGGYRLDRKVKELQQTNRHVIDELDKLKLELLKVSEERDSLRNLIQGPSTNLL